jgi:hypothetical protein
MGFHPYSGELIYNGDKYNIPSCYNLMEYYFDLYPKKRRKTRKLINNSSTYYWDETIICSFKNNELILKDYLVNIGAFQFKSVKHLFVNVIKPVLRINWFTDILICSNDDDEKYIAIQLDKGKIIKDKVMNCEEYKQFWKQWIENFNSSVENDTMILEYLKKTYNIINFEELRKLQQEPDWDLDWLLVSDYNIGKKYLPEPFIKYTNGT